MRIKVIGKAHLKGTSKKTGNPYDFIQVHYNGAAFGVEGIAACTLSLDPHGWHDDPPPDDAPEPPPEPTETAGGHWPRPRAKA